MKFNLEKLKYPEHFYSPLVDAANSRWGIAKYKITKRLNELRSISYIS